MDNRHPNVKKRGCNCQNRFRRNVRRKNRDSFHCDCRDFFDVDLSGSTDNLNFKLLVLKDCKVEIKTMEGSMKQGKTDHAGIDFVDVKDADDHIVTFLKDKIASTDWLAKGCSLDFELLKHFVSNFDHKDHHDHDNHDCRKHDDKARHDDCRCRKHEDDHDRWKDDDKARHDDCRCRKHEDDHDCRKHHDKDHHDDCHCRNHRRKHSHGW